MTWVGTPVIVHMVVLPGVLFQAAVVQLSIAPSRQRHTRTRGECAVGRAQREQTYRFEQWNAPTPCAQLHVLAPVDWQPFWAGIVLRFRYRLTFTGLADRFETAVGTPAATGAADKAPSATLTPGTLHVLCSLPCVAGTLA